MTAPISGSARRIPARIVVVSVSGPARSESAYTKPRLVLALPPGPTRDAVQALLERHGLLVEVHRPPRGSVVAHARRQDADLVVVRRADLSDADRERLDALATDDAAPDVLVLGRDVDDAERADLVTMGAADLVDVEAFDARTARTIEALASGRAHPAPDAATERPPALSDFASRSPRMSRFLQLVERVADTDSVLLLTGETGVGKEHLARAIHEESARRSGPFVIVNCGALPETLLEAELFGHEKGAFTGATSARRGVFEQAAGGTLLLDEIGEMPLHLQVKLLTALQRSEIRPLGSETSRCVDVRIVAATNRDLRDDVAAGRFREDLFYRLNVVELEVPALRARREDLPTLIGGLLRHLRVRTGREDVKGIEPEALDILMRHTWPGNVRELLNVLERALLIGQGARIRPDDLPVPLQGPPPSVREGDDLFPSDWQARHWREVRDVVLARLERRYLDALLRDHAGQIGETARHAGLSPRSLYEKMKRHGLRKEQYRQS